MEHDLSLHHADELKAPVATLCAMFDCAVATAPERVALRHLGAALTYRELGRAVAALAQRLAAMVAPGEVVALVLHNSIEFHIAYFAALKALAAPALLNPLYPAAQLSPLLREATARAVICASATRTWWPVSPAIWAFPAWSAWGRTLRSRSWSPRPRQLSACGPPRPQIPQHCCSAAAPPDFPRRSSTPMVALSPQCAARSTSGRRAPMAKSSSPSRPSPTSTASSWGCSFHCPPAV